MMVNYWSRIHYGISSPLNFISRKDDEALVRFQKNTKIIVTHGGTVRSLLHGSGVEISALVLRFSRLTFLLRNYASILVSLYHHKKNKGDLIGVSLSNFVLGQQGCVALARYLNRVIPPICKNPHARIAWYEELHPSSPGYREAILIMMQHHFGSLDEEALEWAIQACRFDELKQRAVVSCSPGRVRRGNVGVDREEVAPELEATMQQCVEERLDPSVRDVLGKHRVAVRS